MLDAGCWILNAGCWILDAGYWMLETGCWMLETGCWMLETGNWKLDAGYWILDAGCWIRGLSLMDALPGISNEDTSSQNIWRGPEPRISCGYMGIPQREYPDNFFERYLRAPV